MRVKLFECEFLVDNDTMKKNLKPILLALFLGLSLIFLTILMNYSSSKSTAEATIRKLNLNINPKFKSEIYNYYTFDCDKNSFKDLDSRNDLSGLTISFPYIDVSARKNLVQNKTYTITCLPTAIPTYKVVNPEPNGDYFALTDSLLLNNSLSSTYDSAIVLRDSQGTPIWWLSTTSPGMQMRNIIL
jgi:hypothetical protein